MSLSPAFAPEPNPSSLGARVAAARAFRGLSQQALGEAAQVPQSQISKIENGSVTDPSVRSVSRIATALEVSLDALLADNGDRLLEELRASSQESVETKEADPTDPALIRQLLSEAGSPELLEDLERWIGQRRTILVSGSTGSGKTTFVNLAASLIDPEQRLLVLEDTPELQIPHPHTSYVSATESASPKSRVEMRDLIRHCLRYRPDRVIVGEVRGPEAYELLLAVNQGRSGSFTTIHASSPLDALTRLHSLMAAANANMPLLLLRELIAQSIQLVVQVAQHPETNQRRVVEVSQVLIDARGQLVCHRLYGWDQTSEKLLRVGAPLVQGFWDQA